MASIPGVNVIAPVVPTDTTDFHPSHLALYGKGGWRTVASTVERDAIPAARREEGMVVYVTADGSRWILGADLVTWSSLSSSGPTGPAGAGSTGPTGAAGVSITGPTGAQGLSITGPTGSQGASVTGPTGAQGPTLGVPVYLQQTTPTGTGYVWFQTNASGVVTDIING